MIRGYLGKFPKIGEGVFIEESARIIGDVEIGDHSRSLVLGSPASVGQELSPAEGEGIDRYAQNYLMYKENYLKEREPRS